MSSEGYVADPNALTVVFESPTAEAGVETTLPDPTEAVVVAAPPAPTPTTVSTDPRVKELASLIITTMNWTKPAAAVLTLALKIEDIKDATPGQKVKLVQEVLTYVAEESGLTHYEKDSAIFFINNVLPHVYSAILHVTENPFGSTVVEAVKVTRCWC